MTLYNLKRDSTLWSTEFPTDRSYVAKLEKGEIVFILEENTYQFQVISVLTRLGFGYINQCNLIPFKLSK